MLMNDVCKRWIVIYQDHVLMNESSLFFDGVLPDAVEAQVVRTLSLGIIDAIDYTCVEINPHDLGLSKHAMSFRQAFSSIAHNHYTLLARAILLIRWDNHHQFCGRCAAPTLTSKDTFERRCVACDLNFYPRISPCIIVLIQRGEEILMARSPHFPNGVYALIAGFVEAGESIEDAVHREVFEEVGLKIKNLSYFGSQPWPFPDSLMIGFFAEYASGEIKMDEKEIEDAGWYPYNQLPGLPSTKLSIGYAMIEHFAAMRAQYG